MEHAVVTYQMESSNEGGGGRIGILSLLDQQQGNVGIELGVGSGDFSTMLLESGCFKRLFGIDA